MKGKKAISTLLAGMLIVTNIIGNTTSVFAKSSTNFKISNNNYEEKNLIQYVNPLIGTKPFNGSEWSATAPLVTAPFGMTNFTPQTNENRIGDISYRYDGKFIGGFLATHQPAIWMGDYGSFNIMPQIGEVKPSFNDRKLSFSHDDEISTPYYYKVDMGKNEGKPITGEMTATERCALYRFTFPETEQANILIESSRGKYGKTNTGTGNATIDTEKMEVYGWNDLHMTADHTKYPSKNLKCYYVVQFITKDKVVSNGTYKDYNVTPNSKEVEGVKSGAYLTFKTGANDTVEMRIGTSFISVDQARLNINKEIGNKDFEEVKDELKDIWNKKLNVIQIEGATQDENNIFYTAMYHASLYPRKFYETNEEGKDIYFSPYDDKIHEGKSYTDFSLWDTFRAENSFLTLVYPELTDEMVTSLLQNYKEGGYMPKWPNPGYTNTMIGTHADSVVAEAINKGLLDKSKYDLAYEAVLKDAMYPQEGDGKNVWISDRIPNLYEARGGLGSYLTLGYVHNGYAYENVSRTMEFAYDDWCVAQVAKAVGKDKEAKYFLNRSMNYKNVINPSTGFAMGREKDGSWNDGPRPFTEGNSFVYTWCALHDPQGLLDYMTENKGADFYNKELEKAWTENKLAHDNEPSHHYAYMFDFSGRPDLTQKYARQTLLKSYTNDTSGQLGNDDCGQMSAWYIFSAMGFYPVNPASGEYMIGSPIFDKVTINNPMTGKQFIITANNNNDNDTNKNCYIQAATLNGSDLNIPVITHNQITSGGNVTFDMSDKASDWAKDYKKEAIKYDEEAQVPENTPEPPVFDSEVRRVFENLAKDANVSATDYKDASGDIDIPSKSLIDGNYDVGYASKNIHSNTDLANSPYYLTMEWDEAQSKVASFKIWSNYRGSQNPTKMDIEVKDLTTNEWKVIVNDWTPQWKDESGGDNRCSAYIKFDEALKDVTGLRVRIKEANFKWGGIAVRELEVFEDDNSGKIYVSNPTDYVAEFIYCGNKLDKILLNGKELKENTDYKFVDKNNTKIRVFGKAFVENGADSGAELEFVFNQGKSYVQTLVIWDNWKANLESQIKKAEMADNSTYIYSSLEELAPVLEEAKKVLKDETSTEKEYETASIKLQEALDNLVEIDKNIEVYNGSLMNVPGIVANVNGQVKEQEGAYQAFDFNAKTKWCCVQNGADKDGNFWLEVKMPKKYVVDGMGLLSAGNENKNYITKNFSLQVKVDGEWQDILTVTNNVDDSYRGKLPKKVVGDEFRLLTPSTADVPTARVLEFHLYGKELRTELDTTIKEAEALDSSQYTKDSWSKLTTVLENAKAVLADENATEEEVYGALKSLQDTLSALIFVGDKTELGKAIKEVEALDSSQYTKESWSKLATALKNAKAVLADGNATEEVVSKVLTELKKAQGELVLLVDKTNLNKAIKEVESLDKSIYTKDSWNTLEKALTKAKEVVANKDATQDDVDQAFEKLTKAIKQLVKRPGIDIDSGNKPSQGGDKPTTPQKPGSSDKVETGDKAPIVLMATLMALSGAAYCFIRRKEN